MVGFSFLNHFLLVLTIISQAHGKCPFAGDIGEADTAAILAAAEINAKRPYTETEQVDSYKLYTSEFPNKNSDPATEEMIREKRSERIPEEAIRSAVEEGWRETETVREKLALFHQDGGPGHMKKTDSAYRHFVNFRVHDKPIDLNGISNAIMRATKNLQRNYAERFGMTPFTFTEFLRSHGYTVSEISGSCRAVPMCNKKALHYRTIDGSCNNLRNSAWGMSSTALVRITPPKYSDAIYEPPKSVTGHEMPSASLVSLIIFPDHYRPDPVWTRSTMVWGQLMAHDMSLSPSVQAKGGPIQCCTANKSSALPDNQLHPACLPIEVPEFHPFYSKYGVRCLNFVRTMTVPSDGCKLGAGQQMNTVSSYLDLSTLYGSTESVASSLRTFHGGMMKASYSRSAGGEVLPSAANKSDTCEIKSKSEPCYTAGDTRVNLHLDLAMLQTMMLRWHNGIARKLQHLNPYWDDEKIYQEARKFCIAAYQHICYNEWLPIYLGKDFMVKHGILRFDVDYDGYVKDYNPEIPAAVINSHTSSAFRYLHTNAQGILELLSPQREIYEEVPLSQNFNKPAPLEEEYFFDSLLRGIVTQPMQFTDSFVTHQLNGLLFHGEEFSGLDLVSFDIQRHRDHGLDTYNVYRHLCGLRKAKKWEDFLDAIHPEKIDLLRRVYRHVNDVDLLAGIASENHVEGGLLGPTSRCIIGEQYYRTRVGDRFFYMNGKQPGSLNPDQLAEIKKYTWSKLVCETSDAVYHIQPEGFRQLSDKNSLIDCRSLPYIDLTHWKE